MSCCTGDDCDSDEEGLEMNEIQTAPTADMSPGLGVEFETDSFNLQGDPQCSYEQTNQLKGKVLGGRKGDHWELTVDTTRDMANQLQAEYIIDGLTVKIGQNMAGQAGAAVAADLTEWNPTLDSPGMTIEGLDGCTWTIKASGSSLPPPASMPWQRQITAPMPLEALNDIIGKARATYFVNPPSTLLPTSNFHAKSLVYVSAEFFQSSPQGAPKTPTPDVLGFFSLILSYLKGADAYSSDRSPKFTLPIMPRNDFQAMFNLIKSGLGSSLDSGPDALYNIVKTLACYKWYEVDTNDYELEIDQLYCSGDPAAPVVGEKVDQLAYKVTGGSFTIQEWMNDLQANKGDRMTVGDKAYDGQIGGFGDKMEYCLGTTRLVPLFEFRNLGGSVASQFETLISQAENEIISYHNMYRTPLTPPSPKRAVRQIKRQLSACPASTTSSTVTSAPSTTSTTSSETSSTPASITPAPTPPSCELHTEDPDQGINQAFCVCDGSVTLSILPATTAQSESCAYQSIPTGTSALKTITIPTQVWITNCAACTLVGGIADDATCTTVSGCTPTSAPVPTIAAWVGNLSTVNIGDAEDGNNGFDLGAEMFNKLKAKCNAISCTGDHAEMDNVETVIAGEEEPLKPALYFQGAVFSNQDALEKMLSVGIATWIAALNDPTLGLCKNVTYEADADETGSGCGNGPIPTRRLRRKVSRDDNAVLWEREGLVEEERRLAERCLDVCSPPLVCHYEARTCNAPEEIAVVMANKGDPYANHLNIGVALDKSAGSFLCEAIIEDLTLAVSILAPELLEQDILAGYELEAICGAINDPLSAIGSLTDTIKVPHRSGNAARRGLE
ncbi:hypothetical protein F4802DRAFT_596842 [Xylaria palmicola]|nr:hypothetical protein F4802DRAFT_596842 [Xylaria palmicola]